MSLDQSEQKKKNLLVVEDNDRDFEFINLLYGEEFNIYRSESQEEALDILNKYGVEFFSNIILDLLLPDGKKPSDIMKSMLQFKDYLTVLSNSEDPYVQEQARKNSIPFFSKKDAYSPFSGKEKKSFDEAINRIKKNDDWQTDLLQRQMERISSVEKNIAEEQRDNQNRVYDINSSILDINKRVIVLSNEIKQLSSEVQDLEKKISIYNQDVEKIKNFYISMEKIIFTLNQIRKIPRWLWIFLGAMLTVMLGQNLGEVIDAITKYLKK